MTHQKEHLCDAPLFDFDGVLADTEVTRLKAWMAGFRTISVALDVEEYMRLTSTDEQVLQRLNIRYWRRIDFG